MALRLETKRKIIFLSFIHYFEEAVITASFLSHIQDEEISHLIRILHLYPLLFFAMLP